MGLVYKGDDLLRATDSLESNVISWAELITGAIGNMGSAYNDETWNGQAAARFSTYFENIHLSFFTLYASLVEVYVQKCISYVAEYLGVDGDDHAVIYTDELDNIITDIGTRVTEATTIDTNVSAKIKTVSDLTTISYIEPGVVSTLETMKTDIDTLKTAMEAEESSFVSDGFPEIQEMIEALQKLINGGNTVKISGDNRTLAYDPNALAETFNAIVQAYERQEKYKELHKTEFENNQQILQEALERRKDELNGRKALAFGLGVLLAAVGVIVTVATAGTAGPAVTIGISALTGAVSEATMSAMNQWTGDIYGTGEVDGGKVLRDAAIGGLKAIVASSADLGVTSLLAKTSRFAHPALWKIGIRGTKNVAVSVLNRGIDGTFGGDQISFADGFMEMIRGDKLLADVAGGYVTAGVSTGFDQMYDKTGLTQIMKNNKLGDYTGAIVKDQVADGSKRFASTLVETGDVNAAWKKTADLNAVKKTLFKTVTAKATEDYIINRENKKDAAGMSDKKQKAVDEKILNDAKAESAKRYDERVDNGSTPSRSKNHYVNKYGGRHAKKDLQNPEIVDQTRQQINKDIAKGGAGRAKTQAGEGYDNISGIFDEEEYKAPGIEYFQNK